MADGFGDEGSLPIITAGEVAFNGAGEESHETFLFSNKGEYFSFCKTAYKPYDLAVCMALIMAKKRFGKDIEISSDGGTTEWEPALLAADKIFKVNARFVTDNKGDRLEVD